MNLYLLSQTVNDGIFTFDAMVVAAENENEARLITPCKEPEKWWAEPKDVKVKYLGKAKDGTKSGIILESYNEG